MKVLVMINGDDLRRIQGINYVTNFFVKGRRYFQNITFTKVYGSMQIVDVENGEQLPIGEKRDADSLKNKSWISLFLKKLLSSDLCVIALCRYYINYVRPAKNSVDLYLKSGQKADYVLFHSIWSAYYFYKLNRGSVQEKCAVVVHAADDNMGQLFERFPSFTEKIKKGILSQRDYVYNHIDKIVYISQKAYNQSPVGPDKKCVIYNGIDDIDYKFDNMKNNKINLVCVGSMTGWKGQDLIIQAIAVLDKRIRDLLHLNLIGDGAERSSLEKLVLDNNLNEYVTFWGVRKDIPEILSTQDVFIMPSKNEGLSIATVEAIRAGLFLLLTDAGGNVEVMGKNGGLIIKRNVEDIREKICTVVENHLITIEQKVLSRKHYLDLFTTERFISGYENMFASL